VDFPIEGLDLSSYYCGPDKHNRPPVYDLYAVINHHGGILGGHYTSYGRLLDPHDTTAVDIGWRLFDDSMVSYESKNQIVTRSAYVLFYRLRGELFPLPGLTPRVVANMRSQEDRGQAEETRPLDSNILNYDNKPNRELVTAGGSTSPVPSTNQSVDMEAVD